MSKVSQGKGACCATPLMPEGMLGFNRDAMDAYGQTWGSYMEAWNRCGRELIDFAASRLRQDTELGESLMRCRTWAETAEIQRQWMQSALDDYARESEKVMEIMTVGSREKANDPTSRPERNMAKAGAHAKSSGA